MSDLSDLRERAASAPDAADLLRRWMQLFAEEGVIVTWYNDYGNPELDECIECKATSQWEDRGTAKEPDWQCNPIQHAIDCIAADLREQTQSYLWVAERLASEKP